MEFFFLLSNIYLAFKRTSLSTGIRNDKRDNRFVSVGLTFVVIALRSDSRVHGRTAAPGAVVLVEGLVLLREVGRLGQHGR